MNEFTVTITEKLVCDVVVEAATAEEAEMKAGENWDAGEYAHVKQFCDGYDCVAKAEHKPEVTMVGQPVLEVNNDRRIRLSQKVIDGPITVRTLSAPDDPFGHRAIENEYEISAGDMVMLLNWYRFQKAHGNDALVF